MPEPSFQRLTAHHRTLYTMTLLVMGVAYLFAMIQVFSVHANRDGSPWLSPNDLVLAYSGSQNRTQLEMAILGNMSVMLHEEDARSILTWIKHGAEKTQYEEIIYPIMSEHCFSCHGSNEESKKAYPHNPILQGYANIIKSINIDTGASITTLIRVSHIHLFGMTFIFFIIGIIFLHTETRHPTLKTIVLITPFIFILLDIFSWYLTKLYPPFAWVIYFSGFFMAISFSYQWVSSLYQMWFTPKTQERKRII